MEQRAEQERQLRKLGEQPDIFNKLVDALAPSIFGYEDVKRGILCQLFGGTHKDFAEAGRGRFR